MVWKKIKTPNEIFFDDRFEEPVVSIDEYVTSSPTQVPYKFVNAEGNEEDTDWTEEVLVYKLQSGSRRRKVRSLRTDEPTWIWKLGIVFPFGRRV